MLADLMSAPQASPATYRSDAARWTAVQRRDAAADGQFVYSVRSTGVYCRPSCGARLPLRENVAFHADGAAAQAAGFRPCRRCRPDEAPRAERVARLVEAACRRIEEDEQEPSLATLAADAGLSPQHFQRLFKSVVGVSPKAWAMARRGERLRAGLNERHSVTTAAFDAGFNSSARLYANAEAALGMAPQRFRRGGVAETIRFALGECSLGAILVAATGKGLCAILLGDDADALLRDLQDRFPRAELVGGDAGFEQHVAQVVGLVEAPARGDAALPLDIRGTAFQRRVWQALREIPPGSTLSYEAVARAIGAPRAARAVAAACAANALAVAIPCHRVVRQDGSLSGYRWGIARKAALLAREREARDAA
ncbi:bifunctional DNA-binding transcriptional regulator/O6-methylguanine-DNA methyltransferase Ada [Niveibacterium sp. SC-1]|uniref:bifunctional DNA-binding transcriptional regulator/O6-methylguanine-DNA methyltransferase Ada n=1 Tax=Niveibacterium sp. SC-1 TaxID=3135646 RepID=UPI00311F75D1